MNLFEKKSFKKQGFESIIKLILLCSSAICILTTFGILFSILFEAIEFFKMRSFWYFITGTEWSPGVENSKFGALPIFSGTFIITSIALFVAIPLGLGSAIFTSEYASKNLRDYLKPILEILAGIPTVVYGFFAAITVAPAIVKIANFFGLQAAFNSALACGIVMGVMIIPIISSLCDDIISSIPKHQKNASLALGLTKGETIKDIILPTAMPGIISACLLGFSKAIGETMIVVMAAGLRANLSLNPLEDMSTVTVSILNSLTGDFEFNSPETLSAFGLGLILFIVTLVLNMISLKMIKKFKEKYEVSSL
ncbi:MAG: phosphate ABC transporter permease subunit PstC [Proteobacteria bacterium]|nr:MAG: phosphate ABC transporter permease subunit PstC [Pseudomonadota bacterium]